MCFSHIGLVFCPLSGSHSFPPVCHLGLRGRGWFRAGCSPWWPFAPSARITLDISRGYSPPLFFFFFRIILVILGILFGLCFNSPTSLFSGPSPPLSMVWTGEMQACHLALWVRSSSWWDGQEDVERRGQQTASRMKGHLVSSLRSCGWWFMGGKH